MTEGTRIRSVDIELLNDIFEMGSGYVLNFSDKTFSLFFKEELRIDIDAASFRVDGNSKAKRLRSLLRQAEAKESARVLLALWEYREAGIRRSGTPDPLPNHREEFAALVERLGGSRPRGIAPNTPTARREKIDAKVADEIHTKLLALSALDPHSRGFAFEKFLKELFDANGLAGKGSFRLVGEQIDGSFELDGETYLLEAKWTNAPTSAADLRSFNGKVQEKAAWTRGLFVSNSGFSEEGLIAFGRGKSVVCMDGLDLSEMLRSRIPLAELLSRKIRKAAETGKPFVRVRDLY